MLKWLLFMAFCSSAASAQLVLPICSPQSPCPGFPLGSVQAGVDANGWRHFKVTLTQNVTLFSFVGVPPPAQAAINVIFTQDATGGRTVNFAANITNACTVQSAANATTLCQFEYDGVAGVFIGVVSSATIPGGSNTQIQFNNSGGFGGLANSNAGLLFSPSVAGPPAFQNVISATNPQANNNPNDRALFNFSSTTDSSTSTPGTFNDENGIEIIQNVQNGQALFGGATHAKKTFLPLAITGNMQGAGQRFLIQETQNCYPTESDCFGETKAITYQNTPITGDEGSGYQSVSSLDQPGLLNQNSLNTVTRTTCNTTITQATVSASASAQTFTVASTAGCNVNDWVVINQEVATGSPTESPMQITGVGVGTLTGVVVGNYASGNTITPATVLLMNNGAATPWGQGGTVVDLTQPSVTAGTVSSITGAAFTGSGTSWSAGMVGGTSPVFGCISLTADTFTGSPFNGSGNNGPLNTFYRITSVSSSTALAILSWSTAQDAAYHGYGPGAGGYTIRPCAKLLKVLGGTSSTQLILETNTFTWSHNDNLEEAIGAYPDIQGYQYGLGQYTAGGVRRDFMNVVNNGARSFQVGINLTGSMATGSNADTVPFLTGYQANGSTIGFAAAPPTGIGTYGMQVTMGTGSTSHGLIGWQGNSILASIGANPTTTGLELNTTSFAPASVTQGVTSGSIVFGPTDPISGGLNASMPTGEYVGNFDVVQFNSANQPRVGIRGISSSWFLQPHDTGVTCFSFGVYNNKNGGAEGGGVGEMARFNTCGQLLFPLGGGLVGVEAVAPSFNCAVSGNDCLWPDSTAHRWKMQNNNGTVDQVGDTLVQSCGTTTTCSHTGLAIPQIVSGTVALVSGTPSTATVTGISPAFTSSTSFNCTCSDNTTATNACNAKGASASSVTATGANTVTDTVSYICVGN